MKKSAALLATMIAGISAFAHADTSETLLKRIDVKSYEGYMQVTPATSKTVDLDINFIRPSRFRRIYNRPSVDPQDFRNLGGLLKFDSLRVH